MSAAAAASHPATALVTSSYRGDLERCRLLCASIDARVTGHSCHYILVEHADVPVFRALEGPKRRVIDERELLPSWLRVFPDPLTFGRRRLWLSPFGPPLRGWHVQQLRRIAMARVMDEAAMVSCDSDVVFVKGFDVGTMWHGEALEFFRDPGAITGGMADHQAWAAKAGELLGLRRQGGDVDYIATVIGWRRDTVRDMLGRIEAATGASALRALAGTRALSECLIYGRFVDEAEAAPERHRPTARRLCHVYWEGEALSAEGLKAFTDMIGEAQVAVGIQSFTDTDPRLIRQAAGLA
ncbi:DUF6492 family protein [Aurantimonas sp. MSK8Z-1]|uniref:DUF6492 family protein n=1 Tax=Mangrovibrevibacter kandeliae TaxID=2968473 RepID=UPI002118768B|nr:DUF6492 family protein [Aurantimonas sp. MSK8Z-1]MCW4116416.1 DUF6492 family protein [Aurantimonas sp. MSK8Z-1]